MVFVVCPRCLTHPRSPPKAPIPYTERHWSPHSLVPTSNRTNLPDHGVHRPTPVTPHRTSPRPRTAPPAAPSTRGACPCSRSATPRRRTCTARQHVCTAVSSSRWRRKRRCVANHCYDDYDMHYFNARWQRLCGRKPHFRGVEVEKEEEVRGPVQCGEVHWYWYAVAAHAFGLWMWCRLVTPRASEQAEGSRKCARLRGPNVPLAAAPGLACVGEANLVACLLPAVYIWQCHPSLTRETPLSPYPLPDAVRYGTTRYGSWWP